MIESLLNPALTLVTLFGALITVLSLIGVVRPLRLVQLVNHSWRSPATYWLAIGVRLVLGIALVVVAEASLLPYAFVVLGWLLVLSAIVLLIAGRDRIGRALAWFSSCSVFWMRAWCTLGAVFGAFVVYGVMGSY